jgi:hypothetical protein
MKGHQATYQDDFVECVSIEDDRRRRGRRLDVRFDTRLLCDAGKCIISARMRNQFGSPNGKKLTILPKHQNPDHLRNLKQSLERQTTSGLLLLAL